MSATGFHPGMNASILLAAAIMVVGGAMVAAQAPVNAVLARGLGDPVLAACLSFGVGLVLLLLLSIVRGTAPPAGSLAGAPWWAWTGGFFGAFYVAAAAWAVPKLGAVTTLGVVVFGQLVTALILDAIGAFGLPVHAISWTRVAAVVLVFAGLALSRAP